MAPLFTPGNQFAVSPRHRFCHHGCRQSQRRYLREFCSFSLGSPMSPMESQHPSEQLAALTVVWHAEMSAGPSASCSTTLWKSRAQQPPVADMVATLASHLTIEQCYTTLGPATWPVQDVAASAMVGANGRRYKSMVWHHPSFTQDYETSSKATCIYCTATRRLWPVVAALPPCCSIYRRSIPIAPLVPAIPTFPTGRLPHYLPTVAACCCC